MTEQTSKYRYRVSIFQLFSSTILFGVSFVGQKHAVASGIGPLTYTACRFAISTLLLLLFQPLLQHSFHSEVNIESSHNDSFDTSMVTKELLKYAALCGFSSFSASNLQQIGLQTVSAGKAAFITGMYVVFVPIAEYFLPGFGSKLNWRVWFSVLISFIGMYFLSDEGKEMNVSNGGILYSSGELIVLISTLFWVVSIISCDFAVKRGCNGISFTTIGFMVSTVCSLIVALIFESHFFVYPYTIIFKSWDMILLVGITEAISFILGTLGQMYCTPSQASIIFALEGVFAAVGAYFFLGEILTPTELFGCFLMLSAAVFCSFESELDLNDDNSNQNTDEHDKAMIESNFITNLKSSDPLLSNSLPNYSVVDIHDITSKS